jgi:hypothetical protein
MSSFSVAERVGVVEQDDDIYVAHLPDGPILSLTGTAAFVWRAALDGPTEGIADRVAAAAGLPADDIAADVAAFVETLQSAGLLADAEPGGY